MEILDEQSSNDFSLSVKIYNKSTFEILVLATHHLLVGIFYRGEAIRHKASNAVFHEISAASPTTEERVLVLN
jgi:hypothetical protein